MASNFENIPPRDGDRMLVECRGDGPSGGRLVRYPPPVEVPDRGGVYVLVDDGPPEDWYYDWVASDS
jgi:hypothetical protein